MNAFRGMVVGASATWALLSAVAAVLLAIFGRNDKAGIALIASAVCAIILVLCLRGSSEDNSGGSNGDSR